MSYSTTNLFLVRIRDNFINSGNINLCKINNLEIFMLDERIEFSEELSSKCSYIVKIVTILLTCKL
jgi:hypothetical protein